MRPARAGPAPGSPEAPAPGCRTHRTLSSRGAGAGGVGGFGGLRLRCAGEAQRRNECRLDGWVGEQPLSGMRGGGSERAAKAIACMPTGAMPSTRRWHGVQGLVARRWAGRACAFARRPGAPRTCRDALRTEAVLQPPIAVQVPAREALCQLRHPRPRGGHGEIQARKQVRPARANRSPGRGRITCASLHAGMRGPYAAPLARV